MRKLLSTKHSANSLSIGLFLLRAAGGGLIIPHGYDKMKNFGEIAPGFKDPFGIGGTASASLSIFAELFCGILLVLGLFTRIASIPLMINMSVALFYVHKGDVFGEGEKVTLFLAIFLVVLITGPGNFSLDKIIGK